MKLFFHWNFFPVLMDISKNQWVSLLMWLMLSNLPSRIKFISDFLIWGLVKMNMVITLPMPPMIVSRIRKGPLIKYPYRLAYPTNIWDYGEYNKVSLFLQCSKMQIIPLKKIIIQTIFPFCQNGTFESLFYLGFLWIPSKSGKQN